jgi:pyruvate formate lyase activating enzyme
LYVPWGYVAALQVDPIEKKPFYHVYPGSKALTFGMLGCDLHCSYCQNWGISQALRDSYAGRSPEEISPEDIIKYAQNSGARTVVSSYNEPLITSEWAKSIFQAAHRSKLKCLYVSNGNGTEEVLKYLRPFTAGYKIDLKTMKDKNYRKLGGLLKTVLNTIQSAYEIGFWVEIVTLVVPGFNDSESELKETAQFIRSVSADIPWHVTAFHRDYKMRDNQNTSVNLIIRAAEIGYQEGLHFVYAGNIAGSVAEYENTFCPNCNQTLIERMGYLISDYKITEKGCCPKCQTKIPGIWPENKNEVSLSQSDGFWFN